MGGGLSLGKIFGMPIRLHYTWFLIFVLITAALVAYFPQSYMLWQRVVFGLVLSALFLASVAAHELAHSLIARTRGIRVRSVVLFMFGGVIHLSREMTKPALELLLALVGPLASLLIAGLFLLIGQVLVSFGLQRENLVVTGMDWMAFINLMLALLNLIPAYPLDGGRVLRAIIWFKTHNYNRSTRVATFIGRG